jgi:hypothetical protein
MPATAAPRWKPVNLPALPPELLEPIRGHFRVSDGMLDILVAKVMLQGSCIVAIVGELIATGVTQHVRVDAEWHLGSLTKPVDEPVEADRAD